MQTNIDPENQKKLNEPLVNPQGISQEDKAFLAMVMQKVAAKEIDLLRQSTLINQAVYEKLSEEAQGKVDFDAINLASTLRTIYDLWKVSPTPTFQISNLVHQVRLTKERLEAISGDVYVI